MIVLILLLLKINHAQTDIIIFHDNIKMQTEVRKIFVILRSYNRYQAKLKPLF